MSAERKRDPMPTEGCRVLRVPCGRHLVVLYAPDLPAGGMTGDGIRRESIYVAAAGNELQALRFEAFSSKDPAVDAKPYRHVKPGGDAQIPLVLLDGQTALDAALVFFEEPSLLREELRKAGEHDAAANVHENDIFHAANVIRRLSREHAPAEYV